MDIIYIETEKLTEYQNGILNKHFNGCKIEVIRDLTIKDISDIKKVANYFGVVNIQSIFSRSHRGELVIIRDIIMFVRVKYDGLSYVKASAIFGRDHTTCSFAVKKILSYCEADKSFRQKFKEILTELGYDYEKLNIKSI